VTAIGVCFKKVDLTLGDLLTYIDIGDVGLPDIQRPFVWSNAKIRDLFDSMYRGFPVGYLLLWRNATAPGARQIGLGAKEHRVPSLLIVDGQQRLTSLYAVFRGRRVLDEDYRERQIEIAFRPRDGRFEVTDAAIRKNPEFIPNISELWASGKASYTLTKAFLKALRERTPLTDEDEEAIAHNLDRLFDLQKYPFTALEIAETVAEEQVADIFVRINSEGKKLNQADFLLTLQSVFWEEGRVALEEFSRRSRIPPAPGTGPSPFNHFIQPDPDQLLRAGVALAFNRGRLKAVYQVLRGKDLETDSYDPAKREVQFDRLKAAQAEVLDLTHWHQFLHALVGAGFRSGDMISSELALIYAYSFYLIGRTRHHVPDVALQKLIGRWFFMIALTSRYSSGSPETNMDSDLNKLAAATDAASFCALLDTLVAESLPPDFWRVTLPAELDTSSPTSPLHHAYYAALNKLGAPVLFSDKKVSELLDPALKLKKKALEKHHLFPKAWLLANGVTDYKRINQVANFALLEWPDNVEISDDPPSVYVPMMRARFDDEEWELLHTLHALPPSWESMPYDTFLVERRRLIADVIRRGFETLT